MSVLGYIRPELDYAGMGEDACSPPPRPSMTSRISSHLVDLVRALLTFPDALIKDINMDKQVALNSLDRPGYIALKDDPYFARPSNLGPIDLAVLERRVAPATEGEGEKL